MFRALYIATTHAAFSIDGCHRKFCRPEILSRRQFFLGNSVVATISPRRFCRSILTQRPHFLGNSVALLHRDTLPRSTAEFDIGGGTRGHWDPVPPLMSREEAASYIGNAVAAFKIERQNFLGKIVAATEFPGDRISCDTGTPVRNYWIPVSVPCQFDLP